jgi:long-subunit fatty acid transport protein
MKQTVLAVALAIAATSAQATQPVTALDSFVHGQYTFRDGIAGDSDAANRQGINLTVGRNIGYGITLDAGAQVRNENGTNGRDTTRLETGATYQFDLTKDVAFYTRGALGYKLTDEDDSAYYSVEPGVRLQVTKPLSVRVGYRYRTAFNDEIFDKTNTVRVGAEYDINKTNTVTLGIDRSYGDSEFVGINIGYAVKF